MTSSATSTPSPRCSGWASSITAHIGGTWEALRGQKEFWDSGVHPWCFLHFQLIEELIHRYICWEVKIKRQVLLSFEIKLSDLRKWNKTKNPQYVKFVTSWGSSWQTKRCQTLRILSLNQFNVFQKVDGLLKHLAFDNMKKNPAVNPFASDIKPTGMRGHFVREGKVTHTQPYLITRCVQI